MRTPKQGDVLVNPNGTELTVQGMVGDIVLYSNDSGVFQCLLCDLETRGYTIKEGPWKPEKDREYWFVDSYGVTEDSYWFNTKIDNFRLSVGNCFPTKEEARSYRERWIKWGGGEV